MDRKKLARRAYNNAVDRVVSTMSGAERQRKMFKLSCAYEARKSQFDLASFLSFHGLDRVLANMAKEHAEGRIGAVDVSGDAPALVGEAA